MPGRSSGRFAAGAEQARRVSGEGLFTDLRHIGKTIRLMPYARKSRKGFTAIPWQKAGQYFRQHKERRWLGILAITRPHP